MERTFRDSSRREGMETALRSQGFADLFESILVPSIFAPWADELIARTRPIGPADRILDLGCGTGIVARMLRERLGGGARITGLDASAEMIAKARALAPELEWVEANAMALPFADHSFELIVCQQMLQFVPDRAKAVREMRRVLVPGGRLVLATWRARHEQPLQEILGQIAERHLGPPNEKRYALGDEAELYTLLSDAGFDQIRVELVQRDDDWTRLPLRLNALGANHDLSALTPDERATKLAAVEAESVAAASRFIVDRRILAPTRANLATTVAK